MHACVDTFMGYGVPAAYKHRICTSSATRHQVRAIYLQKTTTNGRSGAAGYILIRLYGLSSLYNISYGVFLLAFYCSWFFSSKLHCCNQSKTKWSIQPMVKSFGFRSWLLLYARGACCMCWGVIPPQQQHQYPPQT